jgi:hypothetical protein
MAEFLDQDFHGAPSAHTDGTLAAPAHATRLDGVSLASPADAWWREGLRAFLEAPRPVPFDYREPLRTLCSPDTRRRVAAPDAASAGARVWQGLASLLGLSRMQRLIDELLSRYQGQPVSTEMFEALLLTHGSHPQVVDAFHRFVYGLEDPAPAPELWLRDAREDAGADHSSGTFWDSPDLWLRNRDDGGIAHENPRPGQDNWLHARVRNKAGSGPARHFVVAFQCQDFAGTQFTYPADFLPCSIAEAQFNLAPGETRVVKARWPESLVPPLGTATSLLAALLTRGDPPIAGRHAWEHNNLAQKSLTVVTLAPEERFVFPVVLGNWLPAADQRFDLELLLPRPAPLEASLSHHSRELFAATDSPVAAGPDGSWRAHFVESKPVVPVALAPFSQTRVDLVLAAPRGSKPTNPFKVHLIQRNPRTRTIVGGVALEVAIQPRELRVNVTDS